MAQEDKSLNAKDASIGPLGATYSARVTAPKAIVYADENMNSPLGFISNGKLLTVGNPRKLNRDLVPLVVYGRIGFIQIKDIRYEDAGDENLSAKMGAPREHDIDVIIKKPDEKLSENNSFYVSLHSFSTGDELKNLFMAVDGVEKNSMNGVAVQFIHRQEFSRYFWGAGFDYSFVSSDNLSFGFFAINPTLGYSLMRNSLFFLDVYASMDFTVSTFTDIKNNTENEPSGFVWGPQVNARIVLFPEKKYHAFGGIGVRKYKVMEMESFTDANDRELSGLQNISGLQLFLGVGAEF